MSDVSQDNTYVSRAGLKLASVASALGLDFRGKTVLDVGSSTGGFTDFALRQGAAKVIAVDSGSRQLHASLRGHPLIELHEQTDIRNFVTTPSVNSADFARSDLAKVDMVVIDVSFISLREILPSVARLCGRKTRIVAMVKPQFEAGQAAKHRGVVKNERLRREIFKQFEGWARQRFQVIGKCDSAVVGARGNRERFYLMRLLAPELKH
jgi:23S rRNA (cytidine1920-2'-O)/16S rRNA (cytidine1409-2'-O)-methyltransferase